MESKTSHPTPVLISIIITFPEFYPTFIYAVLLAHGASSIPHSPISGFFLKGFWFGPPVAWQLIKALKRNDELRALGNVPALIIRAWQCAKSHTHTHIHTYTHTHSSHTVSPHTSMPPTHIHMHTLHEYT